MEVFTALLSLVGLFALLLVPGLTWSLLLAGEVAPWTSRAIPALGLSLVVMPLTAFWLNFALGIPLTTTTLAVMALVVGTAPLGYLAWRRRGRA